MSRRRPPDFKSYNATACGLRPSDTAGSGEPQVASDWAPFRDGRWVEIAPWGRTWIDNAPLGLCARTLRPLDKG